jgi:hypothetical protein
MLSAKMDNPVEVRKRECADVALTACEPATRYQIRRQIELDQKANVAFGFWL